jgi:CheY-like chemotaxis protein
VSESEPASYRIALVDDHAPVRAAFSSLLRSFGHRVAEHDSAEALLAHADLARLDCIVTDLQMPGMSGIELLERLRGEGCTLPVILVTAYVEETLRRRALLAGATCFLAKPFNADELLACLQRGNGCSA